MSSNFLFDECRSETLSSLTLITLHWLVNNLFIISILQESSAKAEETTLNAESDLSSSSSSDSSDSEKDENEDEFDEKDVEKLNSLMGNVSILVIL